MTKIEFRDLMDKNNLKLRTNEKHNVKWITIQSVADHFNLSETQIMQEVKLFEIDITSSVTSLQSKINEQVAEDFFNYLHSKYSNFLKAKKSNTPSWEM